MKEKLDVIVHHTIETDRALAKKYHIGTSSVSDRKKG